MSATVLWKAHISSEVGMIWSGGSRNPWRPVSLSSIVKEMGIFASPRAQSTDEPDATSV